MRLLTCIGLRRPSREKVAVGDGKAMGLYREVVDIYLMNVGLLDCLRRGLGGGILNRWTRWVWI